jgi:sulfur-carrier protein
MKVTILYFASLREAIGINRELIELPSSVTTVSAVMTHLCGRGAQWQQALQLGKGLRCAIDQEVVGMDEAITDGAEIAFFPPVTGG